MALAPLVRICYGGYAIEWEVSIEAVMILYRKLNAVPHPTAPLPTSRSKINMARCRAATRSIRFLDLLAVFRTSDATDMRDKVYACYDSPRLEKDSPFLVPD